MMIIDMLLLISMFDLFFLVKGKRYIENVAAPLWTTSFPARAAARVGERALDVWVEYNWSLLSIYDLKKNMTNHEKIIPFLLFKCNTLHIHMEYIFHHNDCQGEKACILLYWETKVNQFILGPWILPQIVENI